MTSHTVYAPLPAGTRRETDQPLTTTGFLKNLLALGSVFWAGYLWLVLAA